MITIQSIPTHLREKGTGEVVVLLHGNPGCGHDFDFVFNTLAGHFRVIAPDMPGFGQSTRPHDFAYNVPAYTLFLSQLLNKLKVDKAHLVMHDMGGAWGLSFATMFPEKIISLSLINTGLMFNYRWHYLARIWQTPVLGELFMLISNKTAMKWALNAANPKPLPDSFIDRMDSYQDRGHKRAVLKLYRSLRENNALQAMAIDRLKDIGVPVHVIWGTEDIYLPVRMAQDQQQVWPQAKLSILEDCGHWPFIDEPELVRDLLMDFLVPAKSKARVLS